MLYKIDYQTFTFRAALQKKIDENVSFKIRTNNHAQYELAIIGKFNKDLTGTFTTGGSASGFFQKGNIDKTYMGVNFKFAI